MFFQIIADFYGAVTSALDAWRERKPFWLAFYVCLSIGTLLMGGVYLYEVGLER